MSYGMSYSDYWYEDPTMCTYYRKSFDEQRKRLDEQLWLQGLYVYNAVACVSPVMNAFAKKGTKPLPYLKSPITQTDEYKRNAGKDIVSEEEKQQQIENDRLVAQLHFNAWARMMNRRFEQEGKKESRKEIK